jgi:hypothetical protein
MSYFDNANNRVTRKSFGSKVDKEFKREGVIPVRDRKKPGKDMVAEAAKYQELNKKVDARRLEEMKNEKAYNEAMQEGYKTLKDELIKDFISEICVEALLVDEDVVLENLKNITDMVNEKVDELGGFEGVKRIAESTHNPVLSNIVSVCEATCKKVGERNLKEAGGCAGKVDFHLNKVDLEEYDYRKKDMGSEVIVNNIKEKVFQVVQDEQQLSSDKQAVMNEIETKVSELDAPVEEAMQFIFEGVGIEEETLFNSLMRSHYKGLMETNSSPIFETFDYKELEEKLFEEYEFIMSDIELVDEEIDNEEIEDLFLDECKKVAEASEEEYENALESLYNLVEGYSKNIMSKSKATHYKSMIRGIQNILEGCVQESVNDVEDEMEEVVEEHVTPKFSLSAKDIYAKFERITESDELAADVKELEKTAEKEVKDTKKVAEEVILCPKCGKEQCNCKVAKEDCSILNEGMFKDKFEQFKKNVKHKRDKKNVEDTLTMAHDVRNWFPKLKDRDAVENMGTFLDFMVGELNTAKKLYPEYSKEIDNEIKWCNTEGRKIAKAKAKEILAESYVLKLEDICESMNVIIDAHEIARANVVESLTYNVDDVETTVPYLQTKDVNLSNLEFAYKVKLVCESLRDSLRNVNYMQEAAVLDKAAELNINSINETLEVIKERSDMDYKSNILNAGKTYLGKVRNVLESNEFEDNAEILESDSTFNTPEDIENAFRQVREYYVIESVDSDLMELVMAEAIVEYTILETFNTLNLVKYDRNSVRQMARKNISK